MVTKDDVGSNRTRMYLGGLLVLVGILPLILMMLGTYRFDAVLGLLSVVCLALGAVLVGTSSPGRTV